MLQQALHFVNKNYTNNFLLFSNSLSRVLVKVQKYINNCWWYYTANDKLSACTTYSVEPLDTVTVSKTSRYIRVGFKITVHTMIKFIELIIPTRNWVLIYTKLTLNYVQIISEPKYTCGVYATLRQTCKGEITFQ